MKYCSTSLPIFSPDTPTVSFNQSLTYGQPQSRTRCALSAQHAVEFVKDSLKIDDRHSWTAISDAYHHIIALDLRRYFDWRFRWSVPDRILKEISQNLIHLQIIQLYWRQILGKLCLHRAISQKRLHMTHYVVYQFINRIPFFFWFECPSLDTRHIQQI